MTHKLFTFLFALMASVGTVLAEKIDPPAVDPGAPNSPETPCISGTCGAQGNNLTWELSCDGVLTISGIGAMEDAYSYPWTDYKSQIQSVVIEENITTLGKYAFDGCANLQEVSLPLSLTKIGGNAFYNCASLASIIIPDNIVQIGGRAFWGCNTLTTAVIGNGITSIPEAMFYQCVSLESISIPDNVTSIDVCAFYGCSSLSSVAMGAGISYIGRQAFLYCSSLTTISVDENNPTYCTIDDVLFSKDATQLIIYPFGKQTSSYTLPASVTNVEYAAFYNCHTLTNIIIPSGVTYLEQWAFGLCSNLSSITCDALIPPSMGTDVFFQVNKSIPLYVPAESIDAYKAADQWKEFNVQAIKCLTASGTCGTQGDNLTWELSCDGVLTISGTGEMEDFCGAGGSDMADTPRRSRKLVVPHSTPWESYESQITSLQIAEGVTSISGCAFSGCTALSGEIIIPSSITSIDDYAFSHCSSLTSITCEAVSPPALGDEVFYSVDKSIPLYVPGSSIAAYKTANQWKDFNIQAIPGTEYILPTVMNKPVLTIIQTPVCGSTDFTMTVNVNYSTLDNQIAPVTLTLTDDIYGDVFATPITIDPAVNPNSISFTLKSSEYPMLVADGATHTLTAKITRIDGHGVDKGGQNSNTYVSPTASDIHTPVLTEQNKACHKTTYDLQVATEYLAFKGTKLHYEWDGTEWTDAENPSLSYNATWATATGKLQNLLADGNTHTLRVYSDDALDCEYTFTGIITAPYGPKISAATATVLPYACGDDKYKVNVEVNFSNGQGHNLIIEDWKGNKKSITTASTDTKAEQTFSYDWEAPTSHAYKVYFVGAEGCATNHVQPSFTAPTESKLTDVAYTISPATACNKPTYDMTVTFNYINQDGTLSVDVDGTAPTSITPAVLNSSVQQTATATFEGMPADGGTTHTLNIAFTGGTHGCEAAPVTLTGVPHLPVINSVKQALAPDYVCGEDKYHVTLTVNYTNALGKKIVVKEGSTVLKSVTANTGAGTFETSIPLDFDFGTNHTLKVYFENRESCAESLTITSPAKPKVTATYQVANTACDKTTYDLEVEIKYTNQNGTLNVNVDGTNADPATLVFTPDSPTEQTLTAGVKDLPADGANTHVLTVAFTDGSSSCALTPMNITAPYSPQISTANATVLPCAHGDANYSVKVEVIFSNGQGHNLIIEDWKGNKKSITTASTDTKAEQTFSYDWETPTTHSYKVYFVGAEGCATNHVQPSFTAPAEPKITITWQDEDGDVLKTDEVAYGETPAFDGTTPTKAATAEYSYEFAGWLPKIKPATEDVRYTTFFERNKIEPTVYTVNINGENCSLRISNEVPAGTTLQVEAVADECFQFQKWSDNETANPRTITVTEDANLTAEFNKLQYTITGKNDSEGGQVNVEEVNP